MAFAGNAQALFSENFENGALPTGWITVDADADGITWEGSATTTSYFQNGINLSGGGHNASNGYIMSGSYSNLYGALTPDNWLITPAINLTANANLTFWVSAQDPDYAAEHYGVYISTTAGTTPADFTLIYEETIDANGGSRAGTWKQKTVNLANYTGQTIRIAFRHFNCTDEFVLNLDDVEIIAQPTDPTIIATPTTLDFGMIVAGITSDYTVNITAYNLTAPVTATTTAPFAVSADGNTFGTTASIAAAGGTLYVQYAPTAVGTDNGTVTLSSTGATDVTITLSGSAIDCGNITIPFTEGFENGIGCWTMISMDPANDEEFGVYADANAYDGSYDFRFSSYATATDYNQYLITPQLTLNATDNYLLRFFYQGYNSGDAFKVLYSTTNNNLSSFIELADYPTVATSWTEVVLELPANAKYVAIDYYGNYKYYLYIDNFSITTVASSMTLSETALDFGDNEMGSISNVQYVVMSTIDVNEPFTVTTAAPFEVSLDGITFSDMETIPADTTLVVNDTIFVRFAPTTAGTFNGNLFVTSTSYIDSVALYGESIDCNSGITVPYTQNFNNQLVPPTCWSIGSDPEVFMSLGIDEAGTDFCIGMEGVDMLITPEIHATDPILVSFDYLNYGGTAATAPTYFHVGYSTTDNNASSFIWQGEQLCATDNFESFSAIVPAGTKYVAVEATQIGTFLYYGTNEIGDIFAIDNFSLIAQANAQMTVSPESMSFGSVSYGSSSPAQIASVIGALLTNNITVTAPANFEVSANGTSYAATATLPQTGGNLYVRYNPGTAGNHSGNITLTSGFISESIAVSGSAIDCSQPQSLPFFEGFESDLSCCWQNIDNDGDGYYWESSFDFEIEGYEGDGCYMSASYVNGVGAQTPNNWLITPALAIPNTGATLTWYVATQDPNWPSEYYEVKLSTTPNTNNFTTVFCETLVSNDWEQRTVNINGVWAGQTVYIAFQHHNSTDMYMMKIDNVSVTALNSVPPTVITFPVNNVETNSATCGGEVTSNGGADIIARGVCWSATSYTPTTSDAHTDNGTGVGSFVSNITGLNPNTTYYVRAYAMNSVGTAYGEMVSFTTLPSCSPVISQFSDMVCESMLPYIWNGATYTASGDYTQTFTAANGCDSIVTLHLTVNQAVTELVDVIVCDNYEWNDIVYTQSGDYPLTLTAANGCDSVVTLHLTLNYSEAAEYVETACDGYIWNDSVYTQSGDYVRTFTNINGCDSVVTMHLTINPTQASEFTVTTEDSCYIWNDQIYCMSGDYAQALQTIHGCDSIVTLHLTITVGIDGHDLGAALMLYPNPTTGLLNVRCTGCNELLTSVDIQVFDAYGKILQTVPMTSEATQLDLSHYADGIYFVKAVKDGQAFAVRKVVKN